MPEHEPSGSPPQPTISEQASEYYADAKQWAQEKIDQAQEYLRDRREQLNAVLDNANEYLRNVRGGAAYEGNKDQRDNDEPGEDRAYTNKKKGLAFVIDGHNIPQNVATDWLEEKLEKSARKRRKLPKNGDEAEEQLRAVINPVIANVARLNAEQDPKDEAQFAVAQVARNGEVVVAHTGNVRAYIRDKEGKLRPITNDDTSMLALVESQNEKDAQEAIRHAAKDLGDLTPEQQNALLQLWKYFNWNVTEENRAARQEVFLRFVRGIDQFRSAKDTERLRLPRLEGVSDEQNEKNQAYIRKIRNNIIAGVNGMNSNVLSSVRDAGDENLVRYTRTRLREGDVEIVIVTDGVHKNLTQREISGRLNTLGTSGQRANRVLYASREENVPDRGKSPIREATDDDKAVAVLAIDPNIRRIPVKEKVRKPRKEQQRVIKLETEPQEIENKYAYAMQRGFSKAELEDAIAYNTDMQFGAVMDGVGGGDGKSGDVAKNVAHNLLQNISRPAENPLEAYEMLDRALDASGIAIADAKQRFGNHNVDTTFATVVRTNAGRDVIAWAGDSRVYVRRPDGLHLLTRDHTLLFAMAEARSQEELDKRIWAAMSAGIPEGNNEALNNAHEDYAHIRHLLMFFKATPYGDGEFNYNLEAMNEFFLQLQEVKTPEDLDKLLLPRGDLAEHQQAEYVWFLNNKKYAFELLQVIANNVITHSAADGRMGYEAYVYQPQADDIEYVIVSDGVSDNLNRAEMNEVLAVEEPSPNRALRLITVARSPQQISRRNNRLRVKDDDVAVVIVPIQAKVPKVRRAPGNASVPQAA